MAKQLRYSLPLKPWKLGQLEAMATLYSREPVMKLLPQMIQKLLKPGSAGGITRTQALPRLLRGRKREPGFNRLRMRLI